MLHTNTHGRAGWIRTFSLKQTRRKRPVGRAAGRTFTPRAVGQRESTPSYFWLARWREKVEFWIEQVNKWTRADRIVRVVYTLTDVCPILLSFSWRNQHLAPVYELFTVDFCWHEDFDTSAPKSGRGARETCKNERQIPFKKTCTIVYYAHELH